MREMGDAGEVALEDAVVQDVALDAPRLRIEVDRPSVGIHFGLGVNLGQQAVEHRDVEPSLQERVDEMGSDEPCAPGDEDVTFRHWRLLQLQLSTAAFSAAAA